MGFGIATSIRVGNHLGANSPSQARTASCIGIFFSFVSSVIIAIFLYFTRDVIPRLFVADEGIQQLASDTVWMLALYQVFDACTGVFQGIFRGSGQQVVAAIIVFIAYWVIGLP